MSDSPFISVRDFVFSIPDSTRRDLITHLVMDRVGAEGLNELHEQSIDEMSIDGLYDRYFF
jgi:hypothetical protein